MLRRSKETEVMAKVAAVRLKKAFLKRGLNTEGAHVGVRTTVGCRKLERRRRFEGSNMPVEE